jgi:hypothetical protein
MAFAVLWFCGALHPNPHKYFTNMLWAFLTLSKLLGCRNFYDKFTLDHHVSVVALLLLNAQR